jgi:hypothetical protein
MAAGATYEPIATQTLGSNQASVTFSSVPSTYTDLVLICNAVTTVAGWSMLLRFNSDTSSSYSSTQLVGTGSSVVTSRGNNLPTIYLGYYPDAFGQLGYNSFIVNIQNYCNTTTFKTALCRSNNLSSSGATNAVEQSVGLWRKTEAISTVSLTAGSGNIVAGSTFTLYGIKEA